MNKELMETIFPDEMNRVNQGHCPFCKKKINMDEFVDALSRKEFTISGLCQSCQDSFFK